MKPSDGSVFGALGVALSGLLASACHRGVAAPRVVHDVAPAPSAACLAALRATLRDSLTQVTPDVAPPPGGWTVASLDAAWPTDHGGRGFAGRCLALPRPADAIPLLRARLAHPDALTAIEVAAALAVLDDRGGVARLRDVGPLTQSGVESFYARAGLTLCGEPIGAALAARWCGIPTLERALVCR